MKKIIIIIVGVLALFGIGKFILFDYSYIPKKSEFTVDLEKVRTLAVSDLELPVDINCLFTGKGELIKWTIAAGGLSVPNRYIQASFQIIYPDKSVILDTPMGEEQLEQFRYGKESIGNNYAKMQNAMKKADLVIFTHEHWDHTSGLAKSPYLNELIDNTLLNDEQINSPAIKEADFPTGVLNEIKPLKYKNYYSAAPGIVIIKAPGHTPGHQWIYVKLQNGSEFLFTGDTVWNFTNIEKEKARPLFATLLGGENPKQIGDQIRWLSKIYRNKSSSIYIVPNHDPEVLETYINQDLFGDTFNL